jgi:hypothetical protein
MAEARADLMTNDDESVGEDGVVEEGNSLPGLEDHGKRLYRSVISLSALRLKADLASNITIRQDLHMSLNIYLNPGTPLQHNCNTTVIPLQNQCNTS